MCPLITIRLLPSVALLSSLGIGTYLGQDDPATDALYRRSVARALKRGLNLVDAAINYRHQRSERAVGKALGELIERGALARDEVVVATKGGFIIKPEEMASGAHCMSPRFLHDQIGRSRSNLGLETLDVY